MRVFVGVALAALCACPDAPPPTCPTCPSPTEPPTLPEPGPLATDLCDDSTYADATWQAYDTEHLTLYYLPGTAAERDIVELSDAREAAYLVAAAELGLAEPASAEVYLSPNRLAAIAHHRGAGVASGPGARVEIIYTGVPGSYEVTQLGHELTHLVTFQVAPGVPGVLNEGVSELFDASGRDLHRSYANQLSVANETRAAAFELEESDLSGANYGRAGSFARHLHQTLGSERFAALLREAATESTGGCPRYPGCDSTIAGLTAMLAELVAQGGGPAWSDVMASWRSRIQAALDLGPERPAEEDQDDIAALVATLDRAMNTDDVALYRSAMEGFYCEWADDLVREDIAARAVNAFDGVSSEVVAIYHANRRAFEAAVAVVLRKERSGAVMPYLIYVERFEVGWRVTWMVDW